jgi:hypothetical protein
MKSPYAVWARFGVLVASVALSQAQVFAQAPAPGQAGAPRSPFGQAVGEAAADRTVPSGANVPEPTPAADLKPASIDLPDEPIEPYLLTKEAGPFMVLARVFRGPDAQRMAIALTKELRTEYDLPAYIFRKKEFPGGSMIRGTPPQAPSEVMKPDIKLPEKIRIVDEAAVMVGDEKTMAAQETLWRAVKKIQPKCLEHIPCPFPWRRGLATAIRTTNPYVPAQNLYPRPQDKLVMQMNMGSRSIVNCPGQFSLQVAEYSGRSTYDFNPTAPPAHAFFNFKESPLRTAHEDAERMAEKLAKSPEIQKLGLPVYVFHDKSTSKVFVGAFNSPQDKAAAAVRDELVRSAYVLSNKKERGRGATDTMIVPALALTDLNDIKSKITH